MDKNTLLYLALSCAVSAVFALLIYAVVALLGYSVGIPWLAFFGFWIISFGAFCACGTGVDLEA